MKVGLTANPLKPEAVALARRVVERIGTHAELFLSDEIAAIAPDLPHGPIQELSSDVLIAIGGDGTFLYALRRSAAPLLPINAGTVGVLSEVDAHSPAECDRAIDRLLEGRYYLEDRMKLGAQIGAEPLPDAINEIVLHASEVGKMGVFELAFDDQVVGRVQADGVIVASPTGSTGYSLSALGPIVDPGLDAIILTTLAPFRVEARALVVDPLRTVRLTVGGAGSGAIVIVDGQESHPLAPGTSVTVYRSPRRATFVRFGSRFFDRLRGKRILPWSEESSEEPHSANLPSAP
ncbi:MAG: NAD(+)/NADH kinase [Thermoplasmata archaeon]